MADIGQGQEQKKAPGIVPPEKPKGVGIQDKPRKLSAPSLARTTASQEVDSTMKSKKLPQWMSDVVRDRKIDAHIEDIRTRGSKSKPETIKKDDGEDVAPCEHCGGMHRIGSDIYAEHMARTGMKQKFGRSYWGGGPVKEREEGFLDAETLRDRGYAMKPYKGNKLKPGTIKKAMSFVNKAGAPGAFAGAVAQRVVSQAKPAIMGRPRGGMYRSKNTVRNPGNPVAEQEQGFR